MPIHGISSRIISLKRFSPEPCTIKICRSVQGLPHNRYLKRNYDIHVFVVTQEFVFSCFVF